MMFVAATAALCVAMLLALVRALLGPTLFDRVLAVNSFGTKTVLTDIALLYALINFIGTLAVLKFFRYGSFSRPGGRTQEGEGD